MNSDASEFSINLKAINAQAFVISDPVFFEYLKKWILSQNFQYSYERAVKDFLSDKVIEGGGRQYQEKIAEELQKRYPGQFAFIGEGEEEIIIWYNTPYEIPVTEVRFFGYFFFFKLSKIEPSAINNFLNYHYSESFFNDIDDFKDFLNPGIDGYGQEVHLTDGRRKIVKRWIKKQTQSDLSIKETHNPKNEFTVHRQILAMYYIFDTLKIPYSPKVYNTVKGRFLEFLLRRDKDQVRKMIGNPLNIEPERRLKDDLRYIRQFFVDLKLGEIVDKIDGDLFKPKK
jgi:hypothetical protein